MSPSQDRYRKQVLFAGLREEGQQRLAKSRVVVCGCGALGTVVAETVVRAGVGHVRIVDRDFVELSNLQRQVLFDEEDVRARTPKAVAAVEKLRRINSSIQIEPVVADIDAGNVRSLVEGADLILDGTDNFEVRFLLNDVSLETGIPWIYAGVIGSHGQTMPVFPGRTACLRCLIESPPEAGSMETCDTAGVIGPAVNVVASLEAALALKILSGHADEVNPELTIVDVWSMTFRSMSVRELREKSACPACHQGERTWLRGERGSQSTVLCGRNAVQVSPSEKGKVSLDELAERWKASGTVHKNAWLARLSLRNPDLEVTVFRDGRAIIQGTEDLATARGIYARYVGS